MEAPGIHPSHSMFIDHKLCALIFFFCLLTDILQNDRSVLLTCNRNPGNGPWYHINEAGNNNTITRGGPKYTGSGTRLIINDAVGADEGQYQCQVGDSVQTAGCVFVLG